mgnify:CR=1 FL=1
MVYFPPEIFRIIYGFDPTYKTVYKECIQEMKAKFHYNRCICLLNSLFRQNLFRFSDMKKYYTFPPYVRSHAKRHKNVNFANILDYYRIVYDEIKCCRYCRETKGKLYMTRYLRK